MERCHCSEQSRLQRTSVAGIVAAMMMSVVFMGSGLDALRRPGMTRRGLAARYALTSPSDQGNSSPPRKTTTSSSPTAMAGETRQGRFSSVTVPSFNGRP